MRIDVQYHCSNTDNLVTHAYHDALYTSDVGLFVK